MEVLLFFGVLRVIYILFVAGHTTDPSHTSPLFAARENRLNHAPSLRDAMCDAAQTMAFKPNILYQHH
jgi:hypothetical protein